MSLKDEFILRVYSFDGKELCLVRSLQIPKRS